jgi:hypothetical protein
MATVSDRIALRDIPEKYRTKGGPSKQPILIVTAVAAVESLPKR